jgi:hypothetical protein
MVRTWFLRDRFVGACLAAALGAHAFGQNVVVVPNGYSTVAGGSASSAIPSSAISAEVQFVIAGGQFVFPPTPPGSVKGQIYITGLSLRAAPGTGPLNVTISGNIYLSNNPYYPNSNQGPLVSTTFAKNVGSDNTLVFSGTAMLSGAGCPGPAPCPFANNIVFTTPYLFEPEGGSIVADLQLTSFGGSGQFDDLACSAPGCSIAEIIGSPLGSPAGLFSYGGPITQFTFTTEPLPFFTGEVSLGNGVYDLQFPDGNLFGAYNFQSDTILFHYDMGFEAFIPVSPSSVYFYDYKSSHWWYTSSTLFPFLYDFTLNAWIYYFPDPKNPGHYTTNPRSFLNLTTGQIFTM